MTKNIAMRILYDGTHYHGWQRQKNGITVQQVLEDTLSRLTGETISVTGCSRTDAGVHALDYVLNFRSHTTIPPDRIPYAVNHLLPDDISAVSAWEVPPDFNARFSARGKRYIYRILNARMQNPFLTRYSWHLPYPLDAKVICAAAPMLEGKHDFSAFMAAGGDQKTTVRTVTVCRAEVSGEQNEIICVTVEADAFLYNMVRIMTGTLAEIGMGRIDPDDLPAIIKSGDRKRCGLTAPPQGLFLKKVYYDLG
ncbi:tRNA pseudouridine(38-40) synthase TruA [Oscillospiraceae bacterium DSM 107454]|uniref:tRNA pseudouridine synthase A n=2 Tax=Ructibacterium gallinarum TaxID=2779355 RepID=A0A9D5M1T6_9FIRM|nr:tRNA pseudouridine(38-40) synthase TruA [Ructibacterium gallinarum]